METIAPYILGIGVSERRLLVRRKCDGSCAGYIHQTEESAWKLQDMSERDYENIPSFASRTEAALFLYMFGRVYMGNLAVNINGAEEPIQIRVSPNFGKWYANECRAGLWAASLHHGDGRYAGATRCAGSVEAAKIAGIQQAYCGTLTDLQAHAIAERLPWQDSADPDQTTPD